MFIFEFPVENEGIELHFFAAPVEVLSATGHLLQLEIRGKTSIQNEGKEAISLFPFATVVRTALRFDFIMQKLFSVLNISWDVPTCPDSSGRSYLIVLIPISLS